MPSGHLRACDCVESRRERTKLGLSCRTETGVVPQHSTQRSKVTTRQGWCVAARHSVVSSLFDYGAFDGSAQTAFFALAAR